MNKIFKDKKIIVASICIFIIGIIVIFNFISTKKTRDNIQSKNKILDKSNNYKNKDKDVNDNKHSNFTNLNEAEKCQHNSSKCENSNELSQINHDKDFFKEENKFCKFIKKFSFFNKKKNYKIKNKLDEEKDKKLHAYKNTDCKSDIKTDLGIGENTDCKPDSDIGGNTDSKPNGKTDLDNNGNTSSKSDEDMNDEVDKDVKVELVVNNKKIIAKVSEVYTSDFTLPMVIFNENNEICYINELNKVVSGKYIKEFDFTKNPSNIENLSGEYRIKINTGNRKFVEKVFEFK